MDDTLSNIYHSLLDITWHFSAHGENGLCCADLSFVEFIALHKISETNKCPIQSIGKRINFTKSGATRIINRLENKGYVLRENSPTDGRICCVSITAKGTQVIRHIAESYISYLRDVLQDVDAQTIEQIKASMDILLEAVKTNSPSNLSKQNRQPGGDC